MREVFHYQRPVMAFPLGQANNHCHIVPPTEHLMRLQSEQELLWKDCGLGIMSDNPYVSTRHKWRGTKQMDID